MESLLAAENYVPTVTILYQNVVLDPSVGTRYVPIEGRPTGSRQLCFAASGLGTRPGGG